MKRKRKFYISTILVIVAYIGCNLPRWLTDNSIREAVYRYQINQDSPTDAVGYYLTIIRKPITVSPSPLLLLRLFGSYPPVKPGWLRGFDERMTGRCGITLSQEQIHWINRNEVLIRGGYYESGLSASSYEYRVTFRHGHWIVTKCRLLWMA